MMAHLKDYLLLFKNSTFIKIISTYLLIFLGYSIEKYLSLKIKITKLYTYYFINNDFILKDVIILYNNRNNNLIKINITEYFSKNKINILKKDSFHNIIRYYHIEDILYNNDMRLLINYYYNNKKYKHFYGYLEINKNKETYNDQNNTELNIPFYHSEYTKYLQDDKITNNMINYFKMNCKDIEYFKINDKIYNNEIIEEYMGPLYDFGLIYKCHIKLRWILDDLLITNFEKFELKYLNLYLDEEDEMDLIEHYIKMNDKNDLLNSNITKKLLHNY
tara:strand:- start:84 stop:911 length:828 start_codon:yes stop_codon:yes gene_type:complete